MAQAQSPDYVQSSADPSINAETGGKKSLFDKIKNKTRDGTKKLKTRLHQGSTGETNEGQSPYSGSEDEAESPHPQSPHPETVAHNTDYNESQPQAEGGQVPVSEHATGTNVGGIFGKGESEPQYEQANLSTDNQSNLLTDDQTNLSTDLSKEFAGLSTTDKGESKTQELTFDSETPLENKEEEEPGTGNTSENISTSKDVAADAAVEAPVTAANISGKSESPGKSWSQWAAEKVGYGKDNISPTTTTTPSFPTETATPETETSEEGKTVTQRAYDVAIQAKDTIHQQAVKPVYEKFTGAKSDAVDDKSAATAESAQLPDPAQQTYMQKATSGIYAAKDSLFTSTHPGEEDRALSQIVTETVGNLPATIKSSLGFGGAKSTTSSSPITNPDSTQTASDEAETASPQSPGIVSRFTSLLGGAKKPGSPSQSDTTADVKAPEESSDTKISETIE